MIANIEAEQSLIGSIILGGNETMAIVQQIIEPKDFLSTEMQTVYNACLKLYREDKPIDGISVLSITGEEYKTAIVSAAQIVPSTKHAIEYARIVRTSAQRQRAYNLVLEFSECLQSATDVLQCQQQAEEILKCFDEPEQDDTVSAEEGYLRFCERQDHPKEYIRTGLSVLDKFTYFERGDYIIIGGKPSAGKTAFTLQMMRFMAESHETIYFSLETNNDKLFDRLVGSYNSVPLSEIKTNSITDSEWQKITEGYNEFRKLKFHSVRAAGYTIDQIRAKALQIHAEVIFVDYATLINEHGNGIFEQATNISKGLHTLAQKNKITVIALAQLSREGKKSLDMSSLRDSGQFEQDADCILLMDYDENLPDERTLKIAKNKEGRCGKIKLDFQPEIQRFSEVETRYDET